MLRFQATCGWASAAPRVVRRDGRSCRIVPAHRLEDCRTSVQSDAHEACSRGSRRRHHAQVGGNHGVAAVALTQGGTSSSRSAKRL
jgi:hypothetical protein